MSSIKVVLKNAVGVKAATKYHYYMHLLNWRFQTWIYLSQYIIWWFCLLMNLWLLRVEEDTGVWISYHWC